MKESILDVLMYLFENYFDDEVELGPDQDTIRVELVEAGFPGDEIDRAFKWLEGLAGQDEHPLVSALGDSKSIRVFGSGEVEKLDLECRGFLIFLEQIGILDPVKRELVIDRIMALDADDVDLDQVKWVVLMVLFNQPDRPDGLAWMENLVLDRVADQIH